MEGQVDEAEIVKDVKQHTYVDGDQYVFMDMVCQHPFSLFHYYNDTINT
jgi:translation elongation factor P/translation initiation factor 5A